MPKPLKVTCLLSSFANDGGGVAMAVGNLCNALAAQGVKAGIVAASFDRGAAQAVSLQGVGSTVVGGVGPRRLGYAPGLSRALQSTDPDIVHVHGLWQYPSLVAAQWTRRTRKPLVISPHGMLEPWALGQRAVLKRLALGLHERRNLEGAACIHALTRAEARDVRNAGVTSAVAVIPNGVHLPPALIASLYRPATKTLLFLGRLHPKKGIAEAISGFRLLHDLAPHIAQTWRFVIHGWDDDGHKNELTRLVANSGLPPERIVIREPVFGPEKDAVFRHADAFILPSHSEGLPMAVLEAWSYGLPVFMTTACNLDVGFARGAAAVIAPSADSIAASLARHLEEAWLLRAAEAGRALAAAQFGWSIVAAQFSDTYAWLTVGGPMPSFVCTD